ncbi:hypothetical protein, partial [Gluconobacter kondonii]|uniref:hypothetical protein n=1 Tax=Gluconobacter kondonii TaxID=941463 RepID=UPI00222F9030
DRGLDPGVDKALGVANGDILGRFNRSSQHPILGGDDDNRKTQIRALDAAQIILARTAACLAT